MRPLTIEETRNFLYKVVKYKKGNLLLFLEGKKKNFKFFRIQKHRIFESYLGILRFIDYFQEHQIGSIGTCLARVTHSNKLLLLVPSVKMISSFPSANSVGCTQNGESLFLQGSHLSQTSLAWANGNVVRGEGVSIIGLTNIILGFGEIINPLQFRKVFSYKKIMVANHGDIGSYTRIF